MKLYFKIIYLLLIISITAIAQNKVRITGHVISHVNEKPMEGAVIILKGTTTGDITDSLGTYEIWVPRGKCQLEISWIGYETLDTTLTVGKNDTLNFIMKAVCNWNKEKALNDIKHGEVYLLIQGGIAPIANSSSDLKFEKHYNVKYKDFGDILIGAEECTVEYNTAIFKFLDERYGLNWRKEIRDDVIGIKNSR